ncbi:MAG: hypothetical protein ABSE45_07630 [Candidatus Acidiferrales bacterium]
MKKLPQHQQSNQRRAIIGGPTDLLQVGNKCYPQLYMSLDNLGAVGNEISVAIEPDERGLTGRECPGSECEGYFKIEFGTGLKGENLPLHCPYCGHTAGQENFWTKAQIEYAQSVALNRITGALLTDLKSLEFERKPPRGTLGIGISMRVSGEPHPIRYYQEEKLETDVVCSNCTLHYAIYGVFAFCPDCRVHNSLQILNKNLDLCLKQVELARETDESLSEHLIEDALENAVSAFDGFGRETVRVTASSRGLSDKSEGISFQNIARARERVSAIFAFDFAAELSGDEWTLTHKSFQKRHLLAHTMGIVDEAYLNATKDSDAYFGRRVRVTPDEVRFLTEALRKLGAGLFRKLST